MSRRVAPLLPATNDLLLQLGERLRLARRRRRLTAKTLASRAGMAPMTLRSVERGGSGVTIGAYLAVMQALGIEKDLDLLAQADPVGHSLQDARMSPLHRKGALQKRPSPTHNATLRERVGRDVMADAHPPSGSSVTRTQLAALFESLPSNQMREALAALPAVEVQQALSALPLERLHEIARASGKALEDVHHQTDLIHLQRWIQNSRRFLDTSTQEQLRKVFASLTAEQMLRALDTVSSDRLRKAIDAHADAFGEVQESAEAASDWLKKGGFVSSDTLAGLINGAGSSTESRKNKR